MRYRGIPIFLGGKQLLRVYAVCVLPLTAVSRDVRHQDKVVSVTGRVLTAGAPCRLFGQLQEVGRTERRG